MSFILWDKEAELYHDTFDDFIIDKDKIVIGMANVQTNPKTIRRELTQDEGKKAYQRGFHCVSPSRLIRVVWEEAAKLYRDPVSQFILKKVPSGDIVVVGIADFTTMPPSIRDILTEAEINKTIVMGFVVDIPPLFRNVKAAN